MLLVQVVLAFVLFVRTTDYLYYYNSEDRAEPGTEVWLPRWLRFLLLDSKKWLFGDANCSEGMPPSIEDYPVGYDLPTTDGEPCGFVYNLFNPELFRTPDVMPFLDDLYSLSSTPFLLLVR